MDKIIIASGPVIVRDNKVLLDISGDDSFWKFCGGKREKNEDLEATAKNRAKEELGINIKILDSDPFIIVRKKPGEEDKEVILVHYLASYSGKISPGPIVKEWAWLKIDDLPENIAPNIKPVLRHFGFL